MSPSDVFTLANTLVIPMWLLMVILPKWRATQWLIDYKLIPLILALGYAFYILRSFQTGGGMDFGSLESVMELFTQEEAVLAGWIHYLVFDLLVGMWMLNENRDLGIHQILMAICLIFTLMMGPVGFILFMILRAIKKSKS